MVQRFPLTLTQLVYFSECAKTLNMTAASQELHVAQSAVSTAITQLERSLGAALFIRQHSKGLVLTPSGERLLGDTQRLFGSLTSTIEGMRADQHEVSGTVTVACFSTLAPFLIPELLGRLRRAHPALTVEVLEGDYDENLAALRGGRADLAVSYNLTEVDGIAREIVGEARPHVILHTDHPLARRRKLSFAELADDPFVLLDMPSSSDYFLSMLVGAGVTPQLKYRSSSYETVRSMVATGLGFSILNQRPRISETYTGASTAIVEISDDVPSLEIAVSSLTQIHPSARARAVAEVVRDLVREPRGTRASSTK